MLELIGAIEMAVKCVQIDDANLEKSQGISGVEQPWNLYPQVHTMSVSWESVTSLSDIMKRMEGGMFVQGC